MLCYGTSMYINTLTHLLKISLTHFMALAFFILPEIHQKIRGFLMFSGSTERDQCYEMSLESQDTTMDHGTLMAPGQNIAR